MSADDLHIGLAEDLAARSDDDLVALFVARLIWRRPASGFRGAGSACAVGRVHHPRR